MSNLWRLLHLHLKYQTQRCIWGELNNAYLFFHTQKGKEKKGRLLRVRYARVLVLWRSFLTVSTQILAAETALSYLSILLSFKDQLWFSEWLQRITLWWKVLFSLTWALLGQVWLAVKPELFEKVSIIIMGAITFFLPGLDGLMKNCFITC